MVIGEPPAVFQLKFGAFTGANAYGVVGQVSLDGAARHRDGFHYAVLQIKLWADDAGVWKVGGPPDDWKDDTGISCVHLDSRVRWSGPDSRKIGA